jgi:sugar lactone lactonase YvrE
MNPVKSFDPFSACRGGALLILGLQIAFLAMLPVPARAEATIQTVAGNYDPTGASALDVSFRSPGCVATNPSGLLYVASRNPRIYSIDSTGVVSIVAGTLGFPGFSGDGGPATDAVLNGACGMAEDTLGNLYIVDRGNQRIRKVDAYGIITTVAGNGEEGFSGDGGPATSARINDPSDVAVDAAGNLYISDRRNVRVRKVDISGIITTVAGGGPLFPDGDGGPATSAFVSPGGLALDGAGNLYIADVSPFGHAIRKVDQNGVITTVAGVRNCLPLPCGGRFSGDGGPATDAELNAPSDLAVDAAGNLYIADSYNHRVRRVDTSGIITTVAGTDTSGFSGDGGPATEAELKYPRDVALDDAGNLYIADNANHRIRKVDAYGIITTHGGNGEMSFFGEGVPAISAGLRSATALVLERSNLPRGRSPRHQRPTPASHLSGAGRTKGHFLLADSGNERVRRIDAKGMITTVAGNPMGVDGDGIAATLARLHPRGLAMAATGGFYVSDTTHRIRKVDADGFLDTVAGTGTAGFSGDGVPAVIAELNFPAGLLLDRQGNLYIADSGNNRVRRVDTSGIITTVAGAGTSGFSGDGGPATEAELKHPHDVALDDAGNLYIADSHNWRIRMVDTDGIITTVAGTGSIGMSGDGGPAVMAELFDPQGLTLDKKGNLYIADMRNHVVRRVDTSGIITTVAGGGLIFPGGDGMRATDVRLYTPTDVEVDKSGDLFILEGGGDRLLRVSFDDDEDEDDDDEEDEEND